MRIESVNGENRVYLDEGEKLLVSTLGLNEEKVVRIENNYNRLDILSPYDKVNEGIVNPEIADMCVSWIRCFKDFIEEFKDVTEKEDMRMVLRTGLLLQSNNTHGKFLKFFLSPTLDIFKGIVSGAELQIDDRNDDIFKYLFAWSVAYYIYYNYLGTEINELAFNTSKSLWSGAAELGIASGSNRKAYADLSSVIEYGDEYKEIVDDLIKVHNKNYKKREWVYNEVLYPIGQKIKSQEVKGALLKDSVNRTKVNYELFLERQNTSRK